MAKMQHAGGFCDKAKRLAFAAFLGDSAWIHTRVFRCCTIDTFFRLERVILYAVLWTSRHFSTAFWLNFSPQIDPNFGAAPHRTAQDPRVWGESPKTRLQWALSACDFSHFKFFVEGG
jgi:hypothetical protein